MRTQAIPTATTRLNLTFQDASGTVVANRVLLAGQTTASIELPTGSDYLLSVQADTTSFPRIAIGTSERFAITRNRATALSVALSPTIQRFAGPAEGGAAAIETARASSLAVPNMITLDGESVLLVEDNGSTIKRFDAAGQRQPLFAASGVAAEAEASMQETALSAPFGVYADPQGNLWFAHNTSQLCLVPKSDTTFYGRERKAGHVYPILAGNGSNTSLSLGHSMAAESTGSLLVTSRSEGKVYRLSSMASATASLTAVFGGVGTPPSTDSIVNDANVVADPLSLTLGKTSLGIAVDANDNLAVTDTGGRKIYIVCRKSGPMFGQQMEAGKAYLIRGGTLRPMQVAFDRDGHLYFTAHQDHTVRRIDRVTRAETIVSGLPGQYTTAETLGNDGRASQATLNFPMGLVISPDNRLFISDNQNHQIRQIHL